MSDEKYWAFVRDGIVKNVMVAPQSFVDNFVSTTPGEWVEYEPNAKKNAYTDGREGTPLRKNAAGIGGNYDRVKDCFYRLKPFPSWVYNETEAAWYPPVDHPDDGKYYDWNEETLSWVLNQEMTDTLPPAPSPDF
jgi:hypothetical protein